jgi:ABC-type Fe3+ transport system substrate-binding protein
MDRTRLRSDQEGKLSLITWGDTWGGPGYGGFRQMVATFQQTFPGIAVDWLPENSASVWLDKVRLDRRAGNYSFDLALVQPIPSLIEGRPEGIWAPIGPLLFRPDVLSDHAWRDGLDARFLDNDRNLCLSWEYSVIHTYAINTDLVQPGEITTFDDLLNPKWRGKFISLDPRLGLGLNVAAAIAKSRGTDTLRQLLVDQRPTIVSVAKDLAEEIALGRYPIALGLRPKALAPFQAQGLAARIRHLDLPDADYAVTTPILYFDRAPHPAAAKLFTNWILTQAGQTLLTSSLPTNSARTDVVPFVPEGIGTTGKPYYEPEREAHYSHTAATQQLVRDLLHTS